MRTLDTEQQNLGTPDRVGSLLLGAGLLVVALRNRSLAGLASALAGGALAWRGISGQCPIYASLGIDTSAGDRQGDPSVRYGRGFRVEKSITIARPRGEIFRLWRELEALPRIMSNLEAVRREGRGASHWVLKTTAGREIEWDAEIINEIENELIGWKSKGDSEVRHAGSVHFEDAPGDQGTVVRVILRYDPPGGKGGKMVAGLMRFDAERLISEDLRNLKRKLEAGEIPTVEGQPRGGSRKESRP
jgi:uncharacterized membrane protein